MNKKLVGSLRECIGDDALDPVSIKRALRNAVSRTPQPEMEYDGSLPSKLNKTGKLAGSEAETFLDSAREYLSSLKRRVGKDIRRYSGSLLEKLKKFDISKEILGDYKKQLEELEEQIKNRKASLDRFNRCLKDLGSCKK